MTDITGKRQIYEWTPGKWWVVAVAGPDGSYTPLYQGRGSTTDQRRRDCERWLSDPPEEHRWQIVNTWNGGKGGRVIVFTSREKGDEGHNECFAWIHRYTPFSFSEATTHQGYVVEPVMTWQCSNCKSILEVPDIKQDNASPMHCTVCGGKGTSHYDRAR